jgi:hypothetical protein
LEAVGFEPARDFNFESIRLSTYSCLLVFTDASELEFVACVLIFASYGESNCGLTLIMAKSRVDPLRQLSITRFKLQGAVLGAQLCANVIKDLRSIASAVYYWFDSQTVLQ